MELRPLVNPVPRQWQVPIGDLLGGVAVVGRQRLDALVHLNRSPGLDDDVWPDWQADRPFPLLLTYNIKFRRV